MKLTSYCVVVFLVCAGSIFASTPTENITIECEENFRQCMRNSSDKSKREIIQCQIDKKRVL